MTALSKGRAAQQSRLCCACAGSACTLEQHIEGEEALSPVAACLAAGGM